MKTLPGNKNQAIKKTVAESATVTDRRLSAAVDVHDAQLGLFNTLMRIELRCRQNIAAFGTEVVHTLVEGDEVNGNIALAHDAPGVTSAAGGAAFDDLHVVETEHRTGIAVTER